MRRDRPETTLGNYPQVPAAYGREVDCVRQSKRTYVSRYGLAFIYAGLRDNDQAFDCLEKAYEKHDVRLRDVKVEPLFENLRFDPRFAHLVRDAQRCGLRRLWS